MPVTNLPTIELQKHSLQASFCSGVMHNMLKMFPGAAGAGAPGTGGGGGTSGGVPGTIGACAPARAASTAPSASPIQCAFMFFMVRDPRPFPVCEEGRPPVLARGRVIFGRGDVRVGRRRGKTAPARAEFALPQPNIRQATLTVLRNPPHESAARIRLPRGGRKSLRGVKIIEDPPRRPVRPG